MTQQVGFADGAVTVHRDGAILRLTLDRPARRNSLSHSMVDALVSSLPQAATDDSLRVIHIRGVPWPMTNTRLDEGNTDGRYVV